ncbi:MAG: MFS transporter [Candidatus Woesearchaeota archaeon]|nr:MFS transporter [Candidatus Woesearchaeota archaeon]
MSSILQNNIWKYNLFYVLRNIWFFTPIYVLFMQENGLNLTQIMILQSLFAICIVVFEVPTGYFADAYGRKNSLVFGSMLAFVGLTIYAIGHNFWMFLVAELIIAVALSLLSGADSALFYDTLKAAKREGQYKKLWGHALFLGLIALAVADIIAGFIGSYNYRWAFYATLPFALLLIPVALSLREPPRHKAVIEKGYAKDILTTVRQTLKNVKLRWLMIYAALTFGFFNASLWLYQPYFQLSGIAVVYFGFIFAAFQVIAAVSSKYAHKIEKHIGEWRSFIMMTVLVGVSYLFMSWFVFAFSFIFAFMQQFIRGIYGPIISDYVNKLTTSDIRATVLSVHSMFNRLAYASLIPFLGWIADVYTVVQALTVLGVTTLVVGGCMLVVLHKNNVITTS